MNWLRFSGILKSEHFLKRTKTTRRNFTNRALLYSKWIRDSSPLKFYNSHLKPIQSFKKRTGNDVSEKSLKIQFSDGPHEIVPLPVQGDCFSWKDRKDLDFPNAYCNWEIHRSPRSLQEDPPERTWIGEIFALKTNNLTNMFHRKMIFSRIFRQQFCWCFLNGKVMIKWFFRLPTCTPRAPFVCPNGCIPQVWELFVTSSPLCWIARRTKTRMRRNSQIWKTWRNNLRVFFTFLITNFQV